MHIVDLLINDYFVVLISVVYACPRPPVCMDLKRMNFRIRPDIYCMYWVLYL